MGQSSAFRERFIIPWETVTADTTMDVNTGYFLDGAVNKNFLLPATSAVGDVLAIINVDTGLFTVTQGVGQQVILPSASSTVGAGGSVASNAKLDAIYLYCSVANNEWVAFPPQGIMTVT